MAYPAIPYPEEFRVAVEEILAHPSMAEEHRQMARQSLSQGNDFIGRLFDEWCQPSWFTPEKVLRLIESGEVHVLEERTRRLVRVREVRMMFSEIYRQHLKQYPAFDRWHRPINYGD